MTDPLTGFPRPHVRGARRKPRVELQARLYRPGCPGCPEAFINDLVALRPVCTQSRGGTQARFWSAETPDARAVAALESVHYRKLHKAPLGRAVGCGSPEERDRDDLDTHYRIDYYPTVIFLPISGFQQR